MEYPLAPEHPFPAGVNAAADAIHWLLHDSGETADYFVGEGPGVAVAAACGHEFCLSVNVLLMWSKPLLQASGVCGCPASYLGCAFVALLWCLLGLLLQLQRHWADSLH